MPWAISLIHDFKVLKKKSKYRMRITFYNGQILVEPFIMIGTKTIPAIEILTKFRTKTTLKKGLKELHS
jgi:hypothetical protein